MIFWPKSLFGQILLTLILGLFIVQLIGAFLVWRERSDFATRIAGYHAADRIAGIVFLLEQSAPKNRQALVTALSVPPVKIVLDQPWEKSVEPASEDTLVFLNRLNRKLDKNYDIQAITVTRQPNRPTFPSDSDRIYNTKADKGEAKHHGRRWQENRLDSDVMPARPARMMRMLQSAWVQVRLSDGQIVTFEHLLTKEDTDWPYQLFILLTLTGILVAILSAWLVGYLTRPLRVLSNAARGLGKNIHQKPLSETGPEEVIQAAKAFNTMQKEIIQYLETRSQTLAALSHDLRLPITRIRLRIESVTDGLIKQKLEDDLEDIDTMIDNTLAFLRAGKSTEEIKPINLNVMIDSLSDDMEALGASVCVSGQISQPVQAQPQALRRSLGNLLDNARRYGDGTIEVELSEDAHHAWILIHDRGPGVSDENKDRVFEPYVRLESSRAKHTGGSGLGMATARTTIRSYGGNITLTDRAGGGLTVEIRLSKKPGSSERS